MEELHARQRKELKDLQGKITAKKKQASKKTRKGVNDECDRLEQDLKARHAAEVLELLELSGSASDDQYEQDAQTADGSIDAFGKPHSAEVLPPSTTRPDGALPGEQPQSSANTSTSRKPNRAKARLERRKAEQEALVVDAQQEAVNMPDRRAAEREQMLESFKSRGLTEKEIRADGHCLYSAFADQMETIGLPLGSRLGPQAEITPVVLGSQSYRIARQAAGQWMEEHPDDFVPFLDEDLATYVAKVKDTAEWGGEMELQALARRFGVTINVLQGGNRIETVKPTETISTEQPVIWLSYYRHGFGLGEHYNSLHKLVP